MKRDAARAGPGCIVDVQSGPEGLSSDGAEHAPRGDHVGRRIADANSPKVDHRAQASAFNEQVGPEQITMDP